MADKEEISTDAMMKGDEEELDINNLKWWKENTEVHEIVSNSQGF